MKNFIHQEYVSSSTGRGSYLVTVKSHPELSDQIISICECKAFQNGNQCRHRKNVILDLISAKQEANRFPRDVSTYIKDSKLGQLCMELNELEQKSHLIKEQIESLKKVLSKTMLGDL